MKKFITPIVAGLALAVLTTTANAALIQYDWDQVLPPDANYTSSGSLTYDDVSGLLTSYTFSVPSAGFSESLVNQPTSITILGNGNLQLSGSIGGSAIRMWMPLPPSPATGANYFTGPLGGPGGDWIPRSPNGVPEGGSTLLLLGTVFAGFTWLRRRVMA